MEEDAVIKPRQDPGRQVPVYVQNPGTPRGGQQGKSMAPLRGQRKSGESQYGHADEAKSKVRRADNSKSSEHPNLQPVWTANVVVPVIVLGIMVMRFSLQAPGPVYDAPQKESGVAKGNLRNGPSRMCRRPGERGRSQSRIHGSE
jgi:hypothetical protein